MVAYSLDLLPEARETLEYEEAREFMKHMHYTDVEL